MLKKKLQPLALGGATLAFALAIGGYMQSLGNKDPQAQESVEVTSVTLTSSAASMAPTPPADITGAARPAPALGGERLQKAEITLAAVKPAETETAPTAQTTPDVVDCAAELQAIAAAGAQVDLVLSAPCNPSERVTIHHSGMMFTALTDADGDLTLRVPALAEQSTFIAALSNGEGAVANIDVSSVSFYDRVVLQWKGNAGLELHAREFGADYFEPGHIWRDSAGDLSAAARGEAGFLTRLGTADTPDAMMVEIYSFPAGTTQNEGAIALSVEAEITASNCDATVQAQTLELRGSEGLRTRDMVLEMPGCDETGDFLVLNNLVEDLTIASN